MEEIFHEKTSFNANLTELYPILIWIKDRISKYLPQKTLDKIELAAEEAIVNIILHAYNKRKGTIQVEVFINHCINLIFRDKGPKFNPLIKKKYHKRNNIKKIGGLGIFIILNSVDEVKYQRKAQTNILTLRMKRDLEY